jgi:hypothetical protein
MGCLKPKKPQEAARTIHVNQNAAHKGFKGNGTSTTKYNLLTYFPKALFEQYRCGARLAARSAGAGAGARLKGHLPHPAGASPTSTSPSWQPCP